MAGSRAFAKVGPKVVPHIDRGLHKVFGGKVLMGNLMLPCAIVTTTGRKSGQPRESPLAAIPHDGALYIVGSNFGRQHHPGWTYNLLDDPTAHVSFRGKDFETDAELLSDDEKDDVWPKLTEAWPLFDQYVVRSGRNIRVFRLRRRDGAAIS